MGTPYEIITPTEFDFGTGGTSGPSFSHVFDGDGHVIRFFLRGGVNRTVSSCTIAGQTATLLKRQTGGVMTVEAWGFLGALSGAQTVSAVLSGTAFGGMLASSYADVTAFNATAWSAAAHIVNVVGASALTSLLLYACAAQVLDFDRPRANAKVRAPLIEKANFLGSDVSATEVRCVAGDCRAYLNIELATQFNTGSGMAKPAAVVEVQ